MDSKQNKTKPSYAEERECFVALQKGDLGKVFAFVNKFGVDAVVDGGTCLHQAIFTNNENLVKQLLESHANPNALYENRVTPLISAIDLHHWSIAKLLVLNGANIDQKDALNNSPLSKAIFHYDGQDEFISLLLSKGADPYLDLLNGYRPIDLAKSMQLQGLLELLNKEKT
jgi:ankyrin repeat protein